MVYVSSKSKIYIYCPANLESGGPEALHQLRFYLEELAYDAYIVYIGGENKKPVIPHRYRIYFSTEEKVATQDDIEDKPQNIVVASEALTYPLWYTRDTQKIIWWLSVLLNDNDPWIYYKSDKKKWKNIFKTYLFKMGFKKKKPYPVKKACNACASEYAHQYLLKKFKINGAYLIEPISKQILENPYVKESPRKNIVAYNPAKMSKTMQRLLDEKGDIEFKAIKNMSVEKIIHLFKTVKLYIDFGPFPGPERMPKEAVYNGCLILVGKRNASENNYDVAIPEEYKIEKTDDIELIRKKIKYLLENYELLKPDFEIFKQQITGLEINFKRQIHEVFKKNE